MSSERKIDTNLEPPDRIEVGAEDLKRIKGGEKEWRRRKSVRIAEENLSRHAISVGRYIAVNPVASKVIIVVGIPHLTTPAWSAV